MGAEYRKVTAREYPAEVLRNRGFICSSRERIRWCKKYLSRIYRRRANQSRNTDLV